MVVEDGRGCRGVGVRGCGGDDLGGRRLEGCRDGVRGRMSW